MCNIIEQLQYNNNILVSVGLIGYFRVRYCLVCAKINCLKLSCHRICAIVSRSKERRVLYLDRFISDIVYAIKKHKIESTQFGISNIKMRNKVYIDSDDLRCPRHNGTVVFPNED